jgi:hypothetical protein
VNQLSRIRAMALVLLTLFAGAAAAEPIGTLHCNDSTGVTRATGRSVILTGVVSAQFSTEKNSRFYLQDATGGVCVFGVPQTCLAVGDSVRVAGDVGSFNGLTQINGSAESPLVIEPFGKASHPVIAMAATPTSIRSTQTPDGCEPNEGRLLLVHDVYVRTSTGSTPAAGASFADGKNYRLVHVAADSASDWVMMRVGTSTPCDSSRTLNGVPIPATPVQVIGVLSQYLGRDATTGGYQILPRTRDDVQLSSGDSAEPRQPPTKR